MKPSPQPLSPEAALHFAAARRQAGDIAGARAALAPLVQSMPANATIQCEWGLIRAAMGDEPGAIRALQRSVKLRPDMSSAWRALGDLLIVAGDAPEAGRAYAQALRAGIVDPVLAPMAAALCDNRAEAAEAALHAHVQRHPRDATAHLLLAEAAMRVGRAREAEAVLAHCLDIAPGFTAARHSLAILHFVRGNFAGAAPHLTTLLSRPPHDSSLRKLLAAALARSSAFEHAIPVYEALLAEYEPQPKLWLLYAHALKAVGRAQHAVAAYRRCIALAPGAPEAFLSLADVKTAHFTPAEFTAMRARIASPAATAEDKSRLHYALGHALENAADYEASFKHYAAGARLRRKAIHYDANAASAAMQRARALYTAPFFAARQNLGNPTSAPIFVLGLPRAGSTLIEQILASHPAVEGTTELLEVPAIAADLGRAKGETAPPYPEITALLNADSTAKLAARYLSASQPHRHLNRPHFIDKNPANFLHIGLIHLLLPNAKIIDIRRAPMAAGFAVFKQYFETDHPYSYDLTEIGRYYRDYAALMAHFATALPGRIHCLQYENLVENTEAEIRALLDYCGLPFHPACLRFWETQRTIQTPSAEQVRQPINPGAATQWRNYEAWLGPLRVALEE
jgi:tetratricopeptide (TPR) repeat protein